MPVAGVGATVPLCALRPEGSPGVQTTVAAGPDDAGILAPVRITGSTSRFAVVWARVLAGRLTTAAIATARIETRLRITSPRAVGPSNPGRSRAARGSRVRARAC